MKIEVQRDVRAKYDGFGMSANTWTDSTGVRRCSIKVGASDGTTVPMSELRNLVALLSRVLEDEGQEMAKTGDIGLYAPGTK